MYKTVNRYKSFFYNDIIMMLQVVIATVAFCLDCIALSIVFFSLYLSVFLIMSDDLTPIILPVCLLCVSVLGQFGTTAADYLIYIPFVVILLISAIVHVILYKPFYKRGKMHAPYVAVSVALITGGLFSISASNYFAPVTLYYTICLGAGAVLTYLIVCTYTRPADGVNPAELMSVQMCYLTLACFLVLVSSIIPYIVKGNFEWYFKWKNTLSTFLLLSCPFAFYLACKEDFNIKAWALFLLGICGYGAAILSYSRGGMLFGSLSLVACLIASLICCKKKNRKIFASITAVLAVTVIVLAIVNGKVIAEMIDTMQINKSEARVRLWKEAVALFLKNPVFGGGIGYQGDNFNHQAASMYWFHSTVFQVIGSMGLVGVAAYAFLYIRKFKIIFAKKRLFNLFFLLSFLGYEAYQLVDASNFVPIPFVMLIVHMFAILEGTNSTEQGQEDLPTLKKEKKVRYEENADAA